MNRIDIYNFKINSDFPIYIFRENLYEVDIITSLDYRTVNMDIEDRLEFIKSRIQFVDVYSILFRISKEENNNIATIHLLKNEGIHSTLCNFEIDYTDTEINIVFKEFYVELKANKNLG